MKEVKENARFVGFDDAPFKKSDRSTEVVGCVFRGSSKLEAVMSTSVQVDGSDATEKLSEVLNSSRHLEHIRAVLLDGVTFGGFNVVDIQELSDRTGLPVIPVMRSRPSFKEIEKALRNVEGSEAKLKAIEKAGEVKEHETEGGKIFFQHQGISEKMAESVLEATVDEGLFPEPLRVAHIVSAGVKTGESRGGRG